MLRTTTNPVEFRGQQYYSFAPKMADFENVEFHRQGYGMLADVRDKDPGSPVCFPRSAGGRVMTGSCTCDKNRRTGSCSHFSELVKLAASIKKRHGGRSWGEVFAESLWYRIAYLLSEGDPIRCSDACVSPLQLPASRAFAFASTQGRFLARLLDGSGASLRFLERAGMLPQKGRLPGRADLLQKIEYYQRSEEEQRLNEAGALTRRQAAEHSFWGCLAYHCFREYGDNIFFHPAVEGQSGDFVLKCLSGEENPVLEMIIPRLRVRKILAFLSTEFPKQSDLAIHPIPLKSIFRVTQKTKLDLEVRPAIQALQPSGETKFFEGEDFAKFRYGDLVYIKEMNLLAELEQPGTGRKFTAPISMNLRKSQLPAFLDEHRREIEDGFLLLDGSLRNLSIQREFDRMEIVPDALKRSWYWLSIRYGFGSESISLAEVLRARREGKSYLETKRGWVDVNSEIFRALESLEKQEELPVTGEKMRLSAVDLLRLMSSFGKPVEVKGEDQRAVIVRRLLAFSPAKPWGPMKGLASPLRLYQVKGVDWLRFLYENGLAGLLCDDMGLGKTHQAMALMVWLKEKQRVKEPFLVICPTTVISHWRDKIREHAPGLKAVVYHGEQREIEDALSRGDVLLTSYGILRNDILALRQAPFTLVVFDEIQNLKNRETQGYQAACALQARMRIGLTGTPIENSLVELKALFDLVLPGYLGSDDEFESRYMEVQADRSLTPSVEDLRKLISPFILRRLKSAVLDELPEKIEDLRTCQLSEMQVKLYRDALSTKGVPLLAQLESNTRRLPYIHIFALLNLLKRICDHPALVSNKIEDYQSFESGKWELFQELLFESLDSGQKVVVFSQYLGMVVMMEQLMRKLEIGFVTLTGASQDRGEIVRRFNEEADCRVFLGSLKAGGAGIDLVAGSVVLHYDRWWNAAREDQATDRVHRIGQRRAVQVFKLVTEGTLEEKISAIIERKRKLMNTVVQADDPHLAKVFTREELIELLRPV